MPRYFEELQNGAALKDIKKGKRKVRQIMTIRRILYQVCKKYNISVIMAHNARFDYKSLSLTLRYITKSKFRYFLRKEF